MKAEDNRMDDLFRERLRDFAPEPSPEVWKRVSESLARKRSVRRMILYRWGSVAALLLLALITGVLFFREPPELPLTGKSPAPRLPGNILPQGTKDNLVTAEKRESDRPKELKGVYPEKRDHASANVEIQDSLNSEPVRIEFASVAGETKAELPFTILPVRAGNEF